MSVSASSRVWKYSKREDSMLVLMLALADWGDDDGISWHRIEVLKDKIRKSERQAKRLIESAIKSGELYVHRGSGRGNPSLYFVTVGLSQEEIQTVLKTRFKLPDLLASEESTAIFDRLKGANIGTISDTKRVTSNDTLKPPIKGDTDDTLSKKKGDIQGTERVTSRVLKGDMHDSSQRPLPLVPDSANPETPAATYVRDVIDTSDSESKDSSGKEHLPKPQNDPVQPDSPKSCEKPKRSRKEKPQKPKSLIPGEERQKIVEALSKLYVPPGGQLNGYLGHIVKTFSHIEEIEPHLTAEQAGEFADHWLKEEGFKAKNTWDKAKIQEAYARWRDSLVSPIYFEMGEDGIERMRSRW